MFTPGQTKITSGPRTVILFAEEYGFHFFLGPYATPAELRRCEDRAIGFLNRHPDTPEDCTWEYAGGTFQLFRDVAFQF